MNVLKVRNLSLAFLLHKKMNYVIQNVNIDAPRGKITALVGESGCGKTMTALCCMGLHPSCSVVTGSVMLNGKELLRNTEKQWNEVRGNRISMVFQDPLSALNPALTVGFQIAETGIAHGMDKKSAISRAMNLMGLLGLSEPAAFFKRFPHQMSGGQRQRVMIAAALMNKPDIIIADEPTSSLDATVQSQIVDLLSKAVAQTGAALLLITHDLSLVERICEDVYIMYCGRIIEAGESSDVFCHPIHPYTKGLLASVLRLDSKEKRIPAIAGTVPPAAKRDFSGCPFYDRCPVRSDTVGCHIDGSPLLQGLSFYSSHLAACRLIK